MMDDTPRRPSLLRALAGFVILVSSLVVLMMGIVLLVTALQRGAYNERPMIEAFGILSIGDAVKSRMDQLEFERDQLTHYLHGQ